MRNRQRIGTAVMMSLALALAGRPAGAADGQTSDKKTLTLAAAKAIAAAAENEARRDKSSGAIAIVDDGGNLLFLERLDNTFPAGTSVAIEKARTAATFRRPTRDFETAIKNGRSALLGVGVMTPLQGGVPVLVDGQVVGAVGVSGAANAEQDDAIATVAAGSIQ